MFAADRRNSRMRTPSCKVPVPAAALLGGEQRRSWNVARNDGSAGRTLSAGQPCVSRIYRESIGDLCSSPEFQVSVPSLFLGGVTLFFELVPSRARHTQACVEGLAVAALIFWR
jgi:hypothetical protein